MAEPKLWQDLPQKPVELQWCQVMGLCQGSILELSSTCSVPYSFSEHLLNCGDWPGKSFLHRTLPSPSQGIQVKLKSTHWQVTAVWWLRLHVGSHFSRKPIYSWSSCPVFQLLLCRLKLMGRTSEESSALQPVSVRIPLQGQAVSWPF